ncbi:hypothetical protein [Aquimarina macrocephali]|uniref:hypothetical protein n=1 Tax=Aquimarina macrocephali TaxID=666563 RepID=UPI000466174B|nr:hypothetical protein [Aquimarina macrocephali]
MKKLNLIIILSCCFISFSLIIPVFLWIKGYYSNFSDSINSTVLSEFASFQGLIIAFWSLILNIILVVLAYKAFKNFDVKKQFHNKQLEIVSELATSISSMEISNMMFKMIGTNKKHQIAEGYTFSFFEIALGFDYSKFDLMCVKSNNIENTFPFLKYRNHPLLPQSISTELNKIYRPLQYFYSAKKLDLKNMDYVLLYHDKEKYLEGDITASWNYQFYENPSDFNKDVTSLRKSIILWYQEYGADELNI